MKGKMDKGMEKGMSHSMPKPMMVHAKNTSYKMPMMKMSAQTKKK